MPLRRIALAIVVVTALAVAALLLLRPGGSSWASSAKGAEFRSVATLVYEHMQRESCPPVTRYPRTKLLADEIRAVRAFETRSAATNAGQQLAIVRADIDHRMTTDAFGCWSADDDPAFAKIHIDMAKKTIGEGLAELARLAPALGPRQDELALSPAKAAAFRDAVRYLETSLHPLCDLSTLAGNDEVFAPARAQADAFRAGIATSPYADHYDIARADAHYQLANTMAECSDPQPITRDALQSRAVQQTMHALDTLRLLMKATPA